MEPHWGEVFSISFYRLNQREIEVMEAEIQQKIDDIRPGETLKAVRVLAEEVRTGKRDGKKLKVGHIMSAIIRNRFLQSHPPTELRENNLKEKLYRLKNAILATKTDEERWEIICDGIHGNQITTQIECEELCPALEAYTIEKFPNFKEPSRKRFEEIVKDVENNRLITFPREANPTPEMRKKLHELDAELDITSDIRGDV